jgi:ABC-2 type transport system ATP-binding protein
MSNETVSNSNYKDQNIAIDVHNITKIFNGKVAVDKLTMKIDKGEIFGFLGPNGSGKTTAIRMLCGLLTPDSGEGTCLGFDIIRQSLEIKRRTGYMPQKFSLYEDLTIRENLEFMARMYSIDNIHEAVDEAIQNLGLKERENQITETLSGGWKQRLALSAALLHDPKLLLLDEPTSGVDPRARREFWDKIESLSDKGLTALVSTHYMDEAERCHKLGYIAYGHLIAFGTKTELLEKYQKATLEEVFVYLMRGVDENEELVLR